ncbi:MAG: DNA-processing protein DprA [Clostridia bacterium]|nr:DNA-processing protein DprA [Clostridia bacterium]
MRINDKRKYWIWLSHMAGQGSKTAVNLVRAYGDAKTVYERSAEDIKADGAVTDKRVLARLAYKDLEEPESIVRWCDENSVSILVPTDKDYPKALLSLQDAPMVLYVAGKLPDFNNTMCCAVVGTRDMSEYGKRVAYDIGSGLADGGACLVSGIALGIDGMAMAGAVEAGGVTVAVLGCGIDIVYPKQHEKLLRRVLEKGAVITEYAPGVSPNGYHFPVRNRIISGLSQAVCVVEGNMKSGSLITARHGIYQGRRLFAVPGRVGEDGAEGTNHLLKQGATPVTCALDILSEFEFIYPHTIMLDRAVPHISPDEAEDKMDVGSRRKKKKAEKKSPEKKAEKPEKTEKKKKGASPFPKEERERKPVRIDLESLNEDDMKVLSAMIPDVPMLCEEIAAKGFELSAVMVSLTMLEVAGAVEAGAGGYYLKRAADFGGEPEYITEDDAGL